MPNLFRFRSLMRLPDVLRLALRLLQDGRVPIGIKVATVGAIALIVSPLDLPGWIPIVGQGFDILLIVKVLDMFIEAAPRHVVREHLVALHLEHAFDL